MKAKAIFQGGLYEFPEEEIKTIHVCIEGMTPIGGWFICKHCGADLRRINEESWKLGTTVRLRMTFGQNQLERLTVKKLNLILNENRNKIRKT